ncbi:hypothetical protein MW887_011468 [Aspergillus wentii]|nr:hypothetical protein MW887_011468 [Aspergillus wentii]
MFFQSSSKDNRGRRGSQPFTHSGLNPDDDTGSEAGNDSQHLLEYEVQDLDGTWKAGGTTLDENIKNKKNSKTTGMRSTGENNKTFED